MSTPLIPTGNYSNSHQAGAPSKAGCAQRSPHTGVCPLCMQGSCRCLQGWTGAHRDNGAGLRRAPRAPRAHRGVVALLRPEPGSPAARLTFSQAHLQPGSPAAKAHLEPGSPAATPLHASPAMGTGPFARNRCSFWKGQGTTKPQPGEQ